MKKAEQVVLTFRLPVSFAKIALNLEPPLTFFPNDPLCDFRETIRETRAFHPAVDGPHAVGPSNVKKRGPSGASAPIRSFPQCTE